MLLYISEGALYEGWNRKLCDATKFFVLYDTLIIENKTDKYNRNIKIYRGYFQEIYSDDLSNRLDHEEEIVTACCNDKIFCLILSSGYILDLKTNDRYKITKESISQLYSVKIINNKLFLFYFNKNYYDHYLIQDGNLKECIASRYIGGPLIHPGLEDIVRESKLNEYYVVNYRGATYHFMLVLIDDTLTIYCYNMVDYYISNLKVIGAIQNVDHYSAPRAYSENVTLNYTMIYSRGVLYVREFDIVSLFPVNNDKSKNLTNVTFLASLPYKCEVSSLMKSSNKT